MQLKGFRSVAVAIVLMSSVTLRVEAQVVTDLALVEVRGGAVSFAVATNVSAISVHGRSSGLAATVRLGRSAEGLVLERVEAIVPVESLATGIGLRDEHMRKYIFSTADGQRPDVRFAADRATCAGAGASLPSTCVLTGDLAIRGTSRPFTIPLTVRAEGNGFRIVGEAIVRLSAYAIEPPSQFGVRTADDVKLRLEFVAKPSASQSTARPGEAR